MWAVGLPLAVLAALVIGALAVHLPRTLRSAHETGSRDAPARPHDPTAAGTPVAPPPGVAPRAIDTRFEDFSSDPGWEGRRNRNQPGGCASVRHDFGYRDTAKAGGAQGEIGGTVFRTHQRAFYASPLSKPITLDDRFSFEGTLNVKRLSRKGSSGILFGLFNRDAEEWRTPQTVVLRLFDSRDEPGTVSIAAEYGTAAYRTDQLVVSERGGVEDPEASEVVTFDLRAPRRFRFDYDPAAAGGRGRIVLSVEGAPEPVVLELLPGHRGDGAVLDRFGMLNQQHEVSGAMEAYFGDLRLNGRPVAAAPEPSWEGRGNGRVFRDCEVETFHNFGYGGAAKTAGGLIWRTDHERDLTAWYADGDGLSLDLDRELYASGRVRLRWANSDSGVYIGWFGAESDAGSGGGSKHVPTHIVAMLIEGPSEVGWFARPVYGSEDPDRFGNLEGGRGTPTVHPDGWHEFAIHYDPSAGPNGEIAVTLDGREDRLAVSGKAREAGAKLDLFGIRNVEDDGHAMMPEVDDLTYTYSGRD